MVTTKEGTSSVSSHKHRFSAEMPTSSATENGTDFGTNHELPRANACQGSRLLAGNKHPLVVQLLWARAHGEASHRDGVSSSGRGYDPPAEAHMLALFFGKVVERPPKVSGNWSHTSSSTRAAGVCCEELETRRCLQIGLQQLRDAAHEEQVVTFRQHKASRLKRNAKFQAREVVVKTCA